MPADTVLAWEEHFHSEFPSIHIVKFASFISSHVGLVFSVSVLRMNFEEKGLPEISKKQKNWKCD